MNLCAVVLRGKSSVFSLGRDSRLDMKDVLGRRLREGRSRESGVHEGGARADNKSHGVQLRQVLLCSKHCAATLTYTSLCTRHKNRLRCIRWRRQWQPTPVLLPGKSHGRRSLVGCSSWGR